MFVIGLHSLASIVVIMYKYNYTIKKRKLNSHIDIFTKMFGQTCSTYTVFIQLNGNLCINDLVLFVLIVQPEPDVSISVCICDAVKSNDCWE